jgi:acyl-CoA synthetase (AMP-forming)/AMP-acid ligase II
MIEWWGPIIYEFYAGTEGNGFVAIDSHQWLTHPGSVGRPLIGRIHILDDDGVEQPTGQEGAIYFDSKAAFSYHNDPAKTAASRSPHGWTTLGDVGYVDADGYLYLTDRKADLIISGGVNIYPREIEDVLAGHPRVVEAAVIGVPDADFGEQVKAVVEPLSMNDADAELEQELLRWCRQHLANVKCPRSVDFRATLPRLASGKLLKRQLRDEYWAGRTSRIV